MQPFLSICIPTYNGKAFLEYNINKFIKLNEKYDFEVCVSDNASTDETQKFMIDIISKYDFIKYNRNEQNFGMAYNFDMALKMANGEYRWLLGDDDEIIEEKFEKILNVLKKEKVEIIVINSPDINGKGQFIKNVRSQKFNERNKVLGAIACQMSWISSCILSEKVIKNLNIKNVNDNIFPHLIEILKYLEKSCNIYWIEEVCARIQHQSKCRYSEKILEYCLKDWCEIIEKIEGYDGKAKLKFVRSTPLIKYSNFINLLRYKKENILNLKTLKKISPYLKYYPFSLRVKFYIAQLFPRFLLKFLAKVKYEMKAMAK